MHSDDYIDNSWISPVAVAQFSSLHTYSRSQLLELKNSPACQVVPDEKTIFRNSRLFPKLFKPDRPQQRNLREPENNGIVLGPQKRSWNTGCHVAEPKRGSNETACVSKNHKPFTDKSVVKKTDSSRETNYVDGIQKNVRKKEKPFARSMPDNSFYSRSYCPTKSNSVAKFGDKPSTNQKEPEWFSGGPTTVDETIELGGILSTSKEKPVNRTKKETIASPKVPVDTSTEPTNEQDTPLSLDKKSEENVDDKQAALEIFDLEFLRVLEKPKTEASGSHFRHLFTKSESNDSRVLSNTRKDNTYRNNSKDLNPDLLNLSSYSHEDVLDFDQKLTKKVTNAKSSATDLESALRSILLFNDKETIPLNTDQKSVESLQSQIAYSMGFSSKMPPSDPAVVSTSRNSKKVHIYNQSIQSPFEEQNHEHSVTKGTFESLIDDLKQGSESSGKMQRQQSHLWDDALVSISLTPQTNINSITTNLNTVHNADKVAAMRSGLPALPLSPKSLSFFGAVSSKHETPHQSRRPIVKDFRKTDDINQPFFNVKSNFDNFSTLSSSHSSTVIPDFRSTYTSESCQNIRDLQFLLNLEKKTYQQSEPNNSLKSKQTQRANAFPKSDFSMPPPCYPFYLSPNCDDLQSSLSDRQQRSTVQDQYTSRNCTHNLVSNCCVSEPLSSIHQKNLDSFRNASSGCSTSTVFKSAAF